MKYLFSSMLLLSGLSINAMEKPNIQSAVPAHLTQQQKAQIEARLNNFLANQGTRTLSEALFLMRQKNRYTVDLDTPALRDRWQRLEDHINQAITYAIHG